MKNLQSLQTVLEAGKVKRYHVREMLREQTLAAHQWRVAVIAGYITRSNLVLIHALLHDVSELITGDLPATAKWNNHPLEQELRKVEQSFIDEHAIPSDVTGKHKSVVKFCDYAELCWYCLDERELGNRTVDDIWQNGYAAACNYLLKIRKEYDHDTFDRADQILLWLDGQFNASRRGSLQDWRGRALGPRQSTEAGLLPGTDHQIRRASVEEERSGGPPEGAALSNEVYRDTRTSRYAEQRARASEMDTDSRRKNEAPRQEESARASEESGVAQATQQSRPISELELAEVNERRFRERISSSASNRPRRLSGSAQPGDAGKGYVDQDR